MSWRRCSGPHEENAIYRRPLGSGELAFYWDTVFNGVSITIGHLILEAESECEQKLFTRENIELAWIRLKQRYPLLAASVEEFPGSEIVEFVLDEKSLHCIRPGEVQLVDTLGSTKDVERLTDEFLNGPPVLTNEITAKLWIGPQRDAPRTYHVFTVVAHYITDGMTGATLQRELCQELASLSKASQVLGRPLEERLADLVAMEDLNPNSGLGRPRRHWRAAAAKIIQNLRYSKLQGGQTLPTRRPINHEEPAFSKTVVIRLSASETEQVIDASRTHGITFGNALPVLSQLALARIVHRRRYDVTDKRLQKINNEEWECRRVQPMHFTGPINVRPYLDRTWYNSGGALDARMAVGLYDFVLPFMPRADNDGFEISDSNLAFLRQEPMSVARWLEGSRETYCLLQDHPINDVGELSENIQQYPFGQHTQSVARWLAGSRDINCVLEDNPIVDNTIFRVLQSRQTSNLNSNPIDWERAPSFSSLLSHARFLARARMVRAQSAAVARHPLLHELQAARMHELYHQARIVGLAWRSKQLSLHAVQAGDAGSASSPASNHRPYIVTNGGASMGNRDLLLPLDYPLRSSSSDRTPARLHIRDSVVHMRCRPGELYLGALTSQGQMNFFVYWDANVYDLELVREWVEEVKAAALYYFRHRKNMPSIDEYTSPTGDQRSASTRAKL